MQIDLKNIEQRVIDEAVGALTTHDDIRGVIERRVKDRIDSIFANRVEAVIERKVDEMIMEGFNRSYCPVDSFGKPVGEPTTISKELDRLINNFWSQRVDRNGKPTNNTHGTTTRAEYIMMSISADELTKNAKQHIINLGGSLKDALRVELAGRLDQVVNDVFRVNSIGDKRAGDNPLKD